VPASAKKPIGSLGGFLIVAIVLTSCARVMAQGVEAGGGGSAPGRTVPGSPGGNDPGAGGGAGAEPCGTPVVSGTGPDGTVAYTPCPGEEPPVPRPQVVVPTPGMADVHARPFDDAKVAGDDVTVNVDFVSGVEPCSVLDHVDVRYGSDAATITLFEGHDPSEGDVACIDIAVFKRVVVTLDQPLDERKIVNGAA